MRLAVAGPHTHLVARRVTSSALIGRGNELTAAVDAATSVQSGQARILLIAGDAGIGKTRLVTEVCTRASQAGMLTAVGGCVQLGEASVAYAPLVGALRELRGLHRFSPDRIRTGATALRGRAMPLTQAPNPGARPLRAPNPGRCGVRSCALVCGHRGMR